MADAQGEWKDGGASKKKGKKKTGGAEQAAAAPAAGKENLANTAQAKAGYPAAKAAPKAAAPKAGVAPPKPAAKQGAAPKAAAKAKEEEEVRPKAERIEDMIPFEKDDGTGGDWEVAAAGPKKNQRKREARAAEEAVTKASAKAGAVDKTLPGAAPQKGKAPAVNQAVGATGAGALTATAAAMKEAQGAGTAEPGKDGGFVTVSVNVPENKIGPCIGPKGATIKMIQEKCQISRIDTAGNVFTLCGNPKGCERAEAAIKEIIEKGYTSLSYDDFAEQWINVHPTAFPNLIGSGGVVIRKIKEELGAEISIPPVPKGSKPEKKFKVTIAGSNEAVKRAKEVIMQILTYYHSEVTHPGEVHEEIEVPDWGTRYIIGTKGSELKHIQSNFKVKVHVPRDYSLNTNTVIVGMKADVERAKKYIEKSLWEREHAPKGRDRQDQADDGWGEEEHESWMDQYLYKRK